MSVSSPPQPIPFPKAPPPRRTRPRVRKLRLLGLLIPLALLALISTVFGMLMAVASDLPQLENRKEFSASVRNSVLTDVHGRTLGILTSNQNRILLRSDQISQWMKFAIISIEDQRFYSNQGIDLRGIARAFVADLTHKRAVQGASTITQQFVKNALQAQSKRTILEKVREAALAYHLTRKWPKDKILTEYLNSIYFGNGAYGIESAARVYFGEDPSHAGCGRTLADPCAKQLQPADAALLAGMVANPSGFDPIRHPAAAKRRRDIVLEKMHEQGYITRAQENEFASTALPAPSEIQPPHEDAKTPTTPYFTTWVRQQIVDRFGAQKAFQGGLRVRTTLDLQFQQAAEQAINNHLWIGGPTASLVAIDNATGEVRAMVGGRDYNQSPFNLATQGQRQPGSAFKPFVLAQALREGISPDSVWPSEKRVFTVPGTHGREHFVVHNDEGSYSGSSTLARALTFSDNSVFAAVGIQVGTHHIARLAERMGIRTPVSSNYAITLGGLRQGVTALDMAHAYETIEHHGERVEGTLGAPDGGPVGIREIQIPGHHPQINQRHLVRVLSPSIADEESNLMASVIQQGTGTAAQLPDGEWAAGKTGTTSNYGDAWFVGFTKRYTVAVWVGYPNGLKPMRTEFHGGPVMGGTFPAEIWHDFMSSVLTINQARAATAALKAGKPAPTSTTDTTTTGSSAPAVPSTTTAVPAAPATTTPAAPSTPQQTTPAAPAQPTQPAPTPAPTPGTGGTGGTSPGTGGVSPGTG